MPARGVHPHPVLDAADPRLSDYHLLRDRERRRDAATFLAESPLVVRRLLAESPFRVRSLLVTPAALDGLRDVLGGTGPEIDVYVGAPALLRQVVGFEFHRGCLAAADRGPALDARRLCQPRGVRTILVLEGVTDPENVGGLFRVARAFGAAGVLLTPGTADPLYPKAIRVSMGAALTVPFARLPGWPADLDWLRDERYTLLALTPAGETEVASLGHSRPVPSRVALLAGNEGGGLGGAALASADLTVRIALTPGADSLNVAVAAGIALHWLQQGRHGTP
jgi:tRNA G18 (ribose-2'-O)-methylase SpoU